MQQKSGILRYSNERKKNKHRLCDGKYYCGFDKLCFCCVVDEKQISIGRVVVKTATAAAQALSRQRHVPAVKVASLTDIEQKSQKYNKKRQCIATIGRRAVIRHWPLANSSVCMCGSGFTKRPSHLLLLLLLLFCIGIVHFYRSISTAKMCCYCLRQNRLNSEYFSFFFFFYWAIK